MVKISTVLSSPLVWLLDTAIYTAQLTAGLAFFAPLAIAKFLTKGGVKAFSRNVETYNMCSSLPFGSTVFTSLLCLVAPYSGSVSPKVMSLTATSATVTLAEKPWLHNPFSSIHAVALTNLGELVSGLVVVTALQEVRGARGIVVKLGATYKKKARGLITATSTVELPGPGEHERVVVSILKDGKGDVVAVVEAVWKFSIPGEGEKGKKTK